jgi:hypothetical protein
MRLNEADTPVQADIGKDHVEIKRCLASPGCSYYIKPSRAGFWGEYDRPSGLDIGAAVANIG